MIVRVLEHTVLTASPTGFRYFIYGISKLFFIGNTIQVGDGSTVAHMS